jgi:hypothetical protein
MSDQRVDQAEPKFSQAGETTPLKQADWRGSLSVFAARSDKDAERWFRRQTVLVGMRGILESSGLNSFPLRPCRRLFPERFSR